MILLRPFRAWRPATGKAHRVGSRSYVSYTDEQLRAKLDGNPYTFLHVIHPDGWGDAHLPRHERHTKVRVKFRAFCDLGYLERDPEPHLYVYEQTNRGVASLGIIAGVSVADYRAGLIKKHEQTLTNRENLFKEYLRATGMNAEPVLLAAPDDGRLDLLLRPITTQAPDSDFTTGDGVRHRFWAVRDRAWTDSVQDLFSTMPALYIADGHHRLASSARLAESTAATDVDPKAWCLAYILPHTHLHILNFDRAVTTLNGLSPEAFIDALRKVGRVEKVDAPGTVHGVVCVRTTLGWHALHLPPPPAGASPSEQLDPARLSELVLGPILGIHDLRTDPHIRFIPGTHGIEELEHLVDSGAMAAAFHLQPVSFEELKAVADTGGAMPPKSTYIEPKLRSGLTVYSLEDV
jgi:uncharacterized protein (DUF1015 family)